MVLQLRLSHVYMWQTLSGHVLADYNVVCVSVLPPARYVHAADALLPRLTLLLAKRAEQWLLAAGAGQLCQPYKFVLHSDQVQQSAAPLL